MSLLEFYVGRLEWYEKTMLLALDQGDAMTPTEIELMAEEADEGESEQEEVSTRR